jgi:hypothetical protein
MLAGSYYGAQYGSTTTTLTNLPLEASSSYRQAAAVALLQGTTHGGPFLIVPRISVSPALHGIEGVEPAPEPGVEKRNACR